MNIPMRPHRNSEGSYLVLGEFMLIALLMTGGLAVDIARKYQLEQRAQDVADAAAKAGALMLPDEAAARMAATAYIQQSAGQWYIPRDSDILIVISADNRTGTCGVIVRGAWDLIVMPSWLVGDNTYEVARHAVALMVSTGGASPKNPTLPQGGFGQFTLIVGDTIPPVGSTCGSLEADIPGNNFTMIDGGTQINHIFDLSGAGGQVRFDDVNAVGTIVNQGAIDHSGTVTTPAAVVEIPEIPDPNTDCILDITNPTVAARYPEDVITDLHDDTGNIVTTDEGYPVQVLYNGLDAYGHQQWKIVGPANQTISGTNNSFGAGFDLKVVGDLQIAACNADGSLQGQGQATIDGIHGCVWTTGSLQIRSNNSDYVATADNPGVVIYTGLPGNVNAPSFWIEANMSQQSIIGLVKVQGTFLMTGNGSNNVPLIKGALWTGRMDRDCGGGILGNNFGIEANGDVLSLVAIIDSENTPMRSTPMVWLKE